ncbi:hypothetical protein [Bacillus sp. J33]|nr:hypothetical protein [Bacillus sp. J33]
MAEQEYPNVKLGGKKAREKGNGGDQVQGHEKENKNGTFNTNPKSDL